MKTIGTALPFYDSVEGVHGYALYTGSLDDIRTVIREEIQAALTDRLLTTSEACELLGVTRQTLDKYIKSGVVAARMLDGRMRFRRSALLEAGRVKYK